MQRFAERESSLGECFRDAIGILCGVGAKLAQQKSSAFRQQQYILDRQLLAQHVVDQQAIEAFQTDRLVREHCWHVIGGNEGIGKAKRHQPSMLGAVLQHAVRLQHGDAGALRPDQCAGYVKPVLRQQLVEVVSGNSPRDLRKTLADELAVGIPNPGQAGIDLPPASAAGDDRLQFRFRGRADCEPGAVVQQNIERLDVIDRLAAHERVYATGVVADHPPERAAAMGSRVGRERKIVDFGGIAQPVEHDARLNPRELSRRIQFQNRVHVFGEVHDHGHIAALSGKTGPASPGKNRCAQFPAGGHRGRDIRLIQGQNQANRHLAVVGSVGGVQGAGSLVEADLAAHHLAQLLFECPRSRKLLVRMCMRLAACRLQDRKSSWGGHGQGRCYQDAATPVQPAVNITFGPLLPRAPIRATRKFSSTFAGLVLRVGKKLMCEEHCRWKWKFRRRFNA